MSLFTSKEWPYVDAENAKIIKNSSVNLNPVVSIIIPAYNAEDYVVQCLESVKNQSLSNIEIIFIDDASTDKTFQKAIHVLEDEPRATILQMKKGSGSPGYGRNLGMAYARAEYVIFVDADDWLDINTVHDLYNSINNSNSDIGFLSGFYNHYEDKSNKRFYKKNYVGHEGVLRGFHESFMLWDKIFRLDFLRSNDIYVGLSKASEEILFIIKAYFYAKKSSVSVGNYGYHYRRLSNNSITKTVRQKIYPSYELEAWIPVQQWAEKKADSAYKDIISLRKILSLNYALSIIGDIHRSKFIREISECLPDRSEINVDNVAEMLGYKNQVDDFYMRINGVESFKKNNGLIFGPNWSSSNPYQKLLYSALSRKYKVSCTGFSPAQLNEKYLDEKRFHCSVLHLHWLHPFYDPNLISSVDKFIFLINYAKQIGYKIYWTAHNVLPHDADPRTLEVHKKVRQEILNVADAVIVHDENSILELRRLFKLSRNKVHIIPHGLYDVREISFNERSGMRNSLGFKENDLVLFTPGRIRAYKGVEKIARIFLNENKLIDKDIKYVVAGAPDDSVIDKELKNISSQVENFKYYPQHQNDEMLRSLFGAADLCLLPYEAGMTSGVSFLSLSYSVPLVTTSLPMFNNFKEAGLSIAIDIDDVPNMLSFMRKTFDANEFGAVFPGINNSMVKSKYQWNRLVELAPYKNDFQS